MLISICYLFLILTSGSVLKFILSYVSTKRKKEAQEDVIPADSTIRDTEVIVGKCENLLIPTLIIFGAYTALAIIFTAKTIVRAEDMKNENTLYFFSWYNDQFYLFRLYWNYYENDHIYLLWIWLIINIEFRINDILN